MGSRVQVAASACFVASGLFMCGVGGALAFAEPPPPPEDPGATHSNVVLGGSIHDPLPRRPRGGSEGPGEGPKKDSDDDDNNGKPDDDDEKGDDEKGDDEGDDEHGNGNGHGGNPDNGNCGNSGSNGNAQGCGGGNSSAPPSDPSTAPSDPPSTAEESPPTDPPVPDPEEPCEEGSSRKDCEPTPTSETSTSTTPPGLPAPGGGGGGGGGGFAPPSGRPEPPQMQLPPDAPTVISVVPGLGVAAAELPLAPITLPVIVAPVVGPGAGGPPAAPANPALPAPPRAVAAEPPAGRNPLPANVGSNAAMPASSYRIGYAEYLRTAGIPQVAALAVPGVGGMLVLTAAGGLVGYRQAKAGHAVRTGGAARFVN